MITKKFLSKKFKKFFLKKNNINKKTFDYIVVSPGININKCDLQNYLKKNLKKIITDLDIFYSNHKKIKLLQLQEQMENQQQPNY